jgi:hypothetical protein
MKKFLIFNSSFFVKVAWAGGLAGLPLAHYWLIARVEPFYSYIYCLLWWPYIFTVDFAVFRLRGRSILHDRAAEFAFLAAWSVPIWVLFEFINLRLRNWYYVMAPWQLPIAPVFAALAYATVLPGVFETTDLLAALIEKFAPGGRISGRPFVVTRGHLAAQLACGAAMLALTLAAPDTCFCLTWGFAYLLADPICYWRRRGEKDHAGRSLLGQIASGDNTRLVALLGAGFVTGGLWELWNLGARTKWIYSVPFFDELKIGEMPVLGFLGFPPFALECYALVNLLSLAREGRNWERDDHAARRGGIRWPASAIWLIVVAVMICFAPALDRSVASYALPADFFLGAELGPRGIQALRDRGALQGHRLLAVKERPPEIAPALWDRLRRLAAMNELKGMGWDNALVLERLNIMRIEDLAKQNPAALVERVRAFRPRVRPEEVRIWIRAATRRVSRSDGNANSAPREGTRTTSANLPVVSLYGGANL